MPQFVNLEDRQRRIAYLRAQLATANTEYRAAIEAKDKAFKTILELERVLSSMGERHE